MYVVYRTFLNYKEDIQILGSQVEYYYHAHIKYGVHATQKLKIYYCYDFPKKWSWLAASASNIQLILVNLITQSIRILVFFRINNVFLQEKEIMVPYSLFYPFHAITKNKRFKFLFIPLSWCTNFGNRHILRASDTKQ